MRTQAGERTNIAYEKNRMIQSAIWLVLIVVGVTLFRWNISGGNSITTEVDNTQIGIVVNNADAVFIPFDEITEIAFVEDMDYGTQVTGVSDEKYLYGQYENKTLGTYELMAFKNVASCIEIKTGENTYVYNLSSDRKTEAEYEKIISKMK